ncbi:MAG: hypothetical protein ACTHOH_10370 [Lysobacteraceae bacterium]
MFFFIVNPLERRQRLLVEHVDALRASFGTAWLARRFEDSSGTSVNPVPPVITKKVPSLAF